MRSRNQVFAVLFFSFLFFCFSQSFATDLAAPLWAKSVTSGTDVSQFVSTTVDSNGNIYAAGYITGTGTYNFGNGITVSGTSSNKNIVLVKYDNNGNAQWAKSVTAGSSDSMFFSTAIDLNGNVYAVGRINRNGTYNFGNSVTVSGAWSNSWNTILVKYDNNGNAQWARSITSGSSESVFYSVSVDSNGNIYAGGYIFVNGSFNFGNGVTVAGTATGYNPVLVKYNSNGNAQWARSVIGGSDDSWFLSVAIDSNENIYAAGCIVGTSTHNFGNSITVAGSSSVYNPVLIKYDSSGNAQLAKSVIAGTSDSYFESLSIDLNGNVYAGGQIHGTGTYNFGNSVAVSGAYSDRNALLVKYGSTGGAQWAKSVILGPGDSCFYTITTDPSGNVYAGGYIYGTGGYDFGNGVMIAGTSSSTNNLVFVRYDGNGNAQWADSAITAPNASEIRSLRLDNGGNIYVVGNIYGSITYDFGNSVTTTGAYTSGSNALLIKYFLDQPPTIINFSKSGYENSLVEFVATDFTSKFTGYLDNVLTKVKITRLPNVGTLKLSGVNVVKDDEIAVEDLGSLAYVPDTNWSGTDSFSWKGSDGTLYSLNPADVNIKVLEKNSTSLTPRDIAVISGSAVTVVGGSLAAAYTIYKCKKKGAYCFKEPENASKQQVPASVAAASLKDVKVAAPVASVASAPLEKADVAVPAPAPVISADNKASDVAKK